MNAGLRRCTFQVFDRSVAKWSESQRGIFLQWGHDSGDEGGSWSVALVEDKEGRVHTVMPDRITFTDKSFDKIWKE